jgi:acylglycerol lipase
MSTSTVLSRAAFDPTSDNPLGQYFTASDGTLIYYNIWKSDTVKPKAVVLAVHGLGEHIHRYDHVFNAFKEEGIVVKGMDYRGHGRTLFKNVKSEAVGLTQFDKVWEDIIVMEAIEVDGVPKGLPTFIMGHSLGGLLALTFAHNHHARIPNFRGVIAQAPAIRPGTPVPGILKMAAKVLGTSMLPRHSQSNNLDLTGLCSDQSVVDAYVVDPLNHGLITMRLARDIFVHGDEMESIVGAGKFKQPVIIYFSPDDKLTGVAGGRLFYERCGSADKTFKEFPGAKHELHNEPDHKAEIIKDYVAWILKRSD